MGTSRSRDGDLLAGNHDRVHPMVLNADIPLARNRAGSPVWWRRWHQDGEAGPDHHAAGRPDRLLARESR
jgi:hypothetical protein